MRLIDADALWKKFSVNPSTGERYKTRDCDNFPITVNLEAVQREIRCAPTVEYAKRGGWTLTDEAKDRCGPDVLAFLKMVDEAESEELRSIDLSESMFNPYTLCEYLEKLGYEKGTQDDNGWEFDFWIPFRKDGHTPVEVCGTGITFELRLSELDYDWKEQEYKNEQELSAVIEDATQLLKQVNELLDDTDT